MAATKVNLNGINELDLNLFGTSIATTVGGVTTITQTPAVATSTTTGVVKPDNKTVQVAADGTLTASGPAPTFVQGASNTSVASTMAVSLSGISLADSLILHVRCGNSSAPSFTGIGNPYVLIHSLYNSFWGVGTYTYICYAALATTESITFTGLVGGGSCVLAEYTPAAGFEAIADNGVSANASQSSSLAITSTKSFERALFIFSVGAFSGQTPNQTQRVPTSGSSQILLMDAAAPASGTTITGTVTSSAMNQSTMTGFFLSSLGVVQSVGLSMPSDFTVTGSPVTSTGILQVTGGATKNGIQQNAYSYAADTGAVNAFAVTLTPAPTLVVGSEVIFKAANTNTGTSTLTVNGTTYPLRKNGTSLLVSGDILVNQIVTAYFDGTNFQILVPGSGGGGGGVTSLNTLTGGLTLVAGSNVTITPSGTNITIASTGGGGGSGYTLISSVTVSGSTTSQVTISSIPSSYKHLRAVVVGRTLATDGAVGNIGVIFNGDTTAAHYPSTTFSFAGTSGTVASASAYGGFAGGAFPTSFSSNTKNGFAFFDLTDYSISADNFPWMCVNVGPTTGRPACTTTSTFTPGSSTTITSITITGVNGSLAATNFAAGTVVYLYGWG